MGDTEHKQGGEGAVVRVHQTVEPNFRDPVEAAMYGLARLVQTVDPEDIDSLETIDLQYGPRVREVTVALRESGKYFRSQTARQVAANIEAALPLPSTDDEASFADQLALEATQLILHIDIMNRFGAVPTEDDIKAHMSEIVEPYVMDGSTADASIVSTWDLLRAAIQTPFAPHEPVQKPLIDEAFAAERMTASQWREFKPHLEMALTAFQESLNPISFGEEGTGRTSAAQEAIRKFLAEVFGKVEGAADIASSPFAAILSRIPEGSRRTSVYNNGFFAAFLLTLAEPFAIAASDLPDNAKPPIMAIIAFISFMSLLLWGKAGYDVGERPEPPAH